METAAALVCWLDSCKVSPQPPKYVQYLDASVGAKNVGCCLPGQQEGAEPEERSEDLLIYDPAASRSGEGPGHRAGVTPSGSMVTLVT